MKRRTIIFLSSIRKYRKSASYMRSCRIPVHLLGIVTRGSCTLSVNGRMRKLEPMQPILLLPGSDIRYKADDGEFEYYILFLEPVTVGRHNRRWELAGLPDAPARLLGGDVRLRKRQQMIEHIERLHEEARKPRGSLNDVKLQLLFQNLYSAMLMEMIEQEELPDADSWLHQSISYLRLHLHENINLERLAEIAKLTPTSYSRKFKRVTGETPIAYLTRIRMEEAKTQLSRGDFSVKEVSALVGFNSEFYFSEVFKKSVGIAPNLYTKRNTLRIAVAACSNFGDILLSLGIAPAASLNCFRYPGTDSAEHSLNVSTAFRTMRQTNPELILIDRYHREYEDRLKQIAPTVCIEHPYDWRQVLQSIAELVGRERNARLQLEQLADRTNDACKRLRRSMKEESLTLLRVTEHAVRIQGFPGHPLNELIYNELGLRAGSANPVIDRKVEVPPEQLEEFSLRSDYLFVQKLRHGPGSDDILKRLVNSSFWQRHEAVQGLRVRFIPNWYAMSWTPGGRNEIIDSLLQLNVKKA